VIKRQTGFTLVELIVVIVVIGILMTFIGVQLTHNQLVARDQERANDVTIITNTLERVYQTGQLDGTMIPTGDGLLTNSTPMGYPSTALTGSPNDTQSQAIIGAIDPNALKSPLKKAMSFVEASSNAGISGNSVGGKTINGNATNDIYVYQPLTNAGTLCTNANSLNTNQIVIAPRLIDACVKYTIYYFSEASAAIQSKTSMNSGNNGL
jgi:prepilin-type N-terminal cleavage/methylation domain-containing protein